MDNSPFVYLPPDILRLLLKEHLPRWMQLVCRMTCVAFRNVIPPYNRLRDNMDIMSLLVSKCGEVPLVEWAYSQGASLRRIVTSLAMSQITTIPLLEWLEKHDIQFSSLDCHFAAKSGNLSALQWFYSRIRPFPLQSACEGAAEGGYLNVVQWLSPLAGAKLTHKVNLGILACRGRLHVLKWLHEQFPFTSAYGFFEIADAALPYGHLNVIQWALEELDKLPTAVQPPYKSEEYLLLQNAVYYGHLDVIEYLCTERHGPLDAEERHKSSAHLLRICAKKGRLDVMKWLRAHNCPWHEDCCSAAAISGHYELLKWMRQNGAPWGSDEYLALFVLSSHDKALIEWARADGCPYL